MDFLNDIGYLKVKGRHIRETEASRIYSLDDGEGRTFYLRRLGVRCHDRDWRVNGVIHHDQRSRIVAMGVRSQARY